MIYCLFMRSAPQKLLIVVAFIMAIAIFLVINTKDNRDKTPFAISECFSITSAVEIETCLRRTTAFLLDKTSVRSLMNFIVASTSPSIILNNCHLIAHTIGQVTYTKAKSLENTLSQCTPSCNNGCVHGAVFASVADIFGDEYSGEDIAHAGVEEVQRVGAKYCTQKTGLCHGIGHVLQITTTDLERSLSACDEIASGILAEACYQGVFMEDAGQLSFVPKPASTIRRSADFAYPCNVINSRYRHACFRYLPDYQATLLSKNDSVEDGFMLRKKTCEKFSQPQRSDCFLGIGYKLDREFDEHGKLTGKGAELCGSLGNADRRACTVGLAIRYSSFSMYDRAVQYCESISDTSLKSQCYNAAFQGLELQTVNRLNICSATAFDECTKEYTRYLKVKGDLPAYFYEGLSPQK